MSARTGGMTTMGILNIVFGSLGCIGGLVMVLAGGAIAAVGAGAEGEGAEGAAAVGGTIGAIAGVFGLFLIALWATVIVAGVGILKLRNWGRILSMVCGIIIVLAGILNVFTAGISLSTILMLVYGGLMFGLMLKPDWKAAFSGEASSDASFETAAAPTTMGGLPPAPAVNDDATRDAA